MACGVWHMGCGEVWHMGCGNIIMGRGMCSEVTLWGVVTICGVWHMRCGD